ncbi:MAG: helix-turn-helix domain-containing protein [Prevotella sp.]|uniref:winged helix-turn-helix transcriptional regulator n=1 Tax=Prevotella sp. TaxID=59823 RepID=UPI002A2C9884|nr:helix-turn-helix domain-containing protein [Prevotella sp.]MDD7317810.1 helix-turn-helix domain-containing protein [Prevotellaceae bacterium]MDY4020725.1 helix-turn-helix domain-containing protein [Prevotella sp.]
MIRRQVTDPVFPQCPVRNVLSRIGDRWSLLTLLALHDADRPLRFNELCKAIPGVSQKMLASTLRDLEADDLLSRTAYPEIPPRVEYSLTDRGRSLMPLLNQLVEWSLSNMSEIIASRKHYAEIHAKECR